MEVTVLGLVTKIGYVVIVGATSILANTLITYHHNHKYTFSLNKSSRGEKNENKSTSKKLEELRSIHQAD